MCYNRCEHFSFNPMTGEGTCKKGKLRCPEEPPLSECCGVEMNEWPDVDLCSKCLEHSGPAEDEDDDGY